MSYTILCCVYRANVGELLNKFQYVDGLSSLSYRVVSTTKERLFTRLLVKIEGPRTQREMKQHFDAEIKKLTKQIS